MIRQFVTGGMVRRSWDQKGKKKGGVGVFWEHGTFSFAALLFPFFLLSVRTIPPRTQ